METSSFFLLKTLLKQDITIDYYDSDRLLSNFPAQLRMSNDDIRKIFPRALPFSRIGNYLSFSFEPVLGFKADNNIEWYGAKDLEGLNGKFLIVTFGGSTTVLDNWPKYLINCAEKEGVKQDIAVFNAGHWGYMSFNEKIYFTTYILPFLKKHNLKPDLVLSLDGVNDTWARIMGYFESRNNNSNIWYSQYHGYHQQLYSDINNLHKFSTLIEQLFSTGSRALYTFAIHYFTPIFPYTMKTVLQTMRMFLQRPASGMKKKKEVVLAGDVEDLMADGFKSCLLDFMGSAMVRDIEFVSYLQPVLLKRYYPHNVSESHTYPNFNYFGVNFASENRHWNRFNEGSIISTERLYEKYEKVFSDLAESYSCVCF